MNKWPILGAARWARDLGSKWVRRLASRNYYCAKMLYHLSLRLANPHTREALLVYQMGKVGSTSVVRSLKALDLGMPVYHVHDLTRDTLDRDEKLYKREFAISGLQPRHLWESQYLLRQIESRGRRCRWKVVTLVRDPIARNISGFFQTLQSEFGFDYEKAESMRDDDVVEEVIGIFLDRVTWHDYPLTWFDVELKSVFGIDVFASEFPVAKGYKTYEGENADALVLRLENLSDVASEAFREFLEIDGFTLIKGNISSEKGYYALYRKFLDDIVLPESYIDRMYGSKYAQHFYSEEEIRAFRARWTRGNGARGRTIA